MTKMPATKAPVTSDELPFDDVLRQLLRAKPQHKVAKKKAPAKKTAKR